MMGTLDSDFRCEVQSRKLKKHWNFYHTKRTSLKLCRSLFKTYCGKTSLSSAQIIFTIVLVIIQAVSEMLTPFFLYHLIEFLQDPDDNDYSQAYLLIAGILGSQYLLFMF